jgi:hypothetical protein
MRLDDRSTAGTGQNTANRQFQNPDIADSDTHAIVEKSLNLPTNFPKAFHSDLTDGITHTFRIFSGK